MMSSPQVPQLIMPGSQSGGWEFGLFVIHHICVFLPVLSDGQAYGTHFWVDPADDLYAVYEKLII